VLLHAPAGYGKSTVLAQWAQRDASPYAWVDAGRCGNGPAGLGQQLAGALDRLARALAPRRRTRRSPAPAAQLGALIAAADQVAACGEATLVVDDVHRLQSQRALDLLGRLVHEAPQALRIMLASRSEPALGLARLRAAGELLSVDATDLSMNAHEAHELLRSTGLDLGEEEILRLLERSEGWPAGLHLTAEAMSECGAEVEVEALGVTHHTVLQYLHEELLQPLAPSARALLVRTAILDQLSGPLCDAVADTSGSGVVLQQLAADGAMLVPVDPAHSWFRCHTMLRDALRAELEASEAAGIRPLHLRASSWFERMGEVDTALQHAFAARDTETAAALLWSHAPQYLYGGDALVQRWLSGLTPEEIGASPGLALAAAHSHLALGDAASARHWAQVGAESMPKAQSAEARALGRAAELIELATGSCGGEDTAAVAARMAADASGTGALRPLALFLQGMALALRDDRDAARAPFVAAAEACTSSMPVIAALALTELALDNVADGAWERGHDQIQDALATLQGHGLETLPSAALTHAVAALVMACSGSADDAKAEVVIASRRLDRLGRHVAWYEVQARVALARACTRLADVGAARSLLAQASRLARGPHSVPLFVTWLDQAWGEIDDAGAAALNGPGSLTMAELRVLRFLPSHLSFREIGERLNVSPNTIKSQAHATYAKLGAGSRGEAVAHAAALGLIDAQIV
jgi:LuxR family maltose regulon positive regulatory protein